MAKGEYAMELRRKRIYLIIDAVKNSGSTGIDVKKLEALQSIEWGCTRRKMKEYIDDIVDAGLAKLIDGVLYAA